MKNLTILVVGGAGFIGSHVNRELHTQGFNTLVFDNLSSGMAQAVTQGRLVKGDLSDKDSLRQLFQSEPIGAVLHFAALIDVGESFQKPAEYYRNNVANTLNLLEVMVSSGVKKLVFSSSAGVYGLPRQELMDESHPKDPINPYGRTKYMVEQILQDFDHAYGLKSCCLRYFNAAGGDPTGEVKNFKAKESNLIPVVLRSLKEQRPLTIFGTDYPTPDGTCVRDYVHVMDLAQAHVGGLRLLLQGGDSDQYNLGIGRGFSIRQVVDAAQQVTGLPLEVREGPRRPGDPPSLVACARKARERLGWEPAFQDLPTMIRHAWQALT